VMTGAQEVPGPGDPDGFGVFAAVTEGDTLCYLVTARRIEPAAAAHIHAGARGVAGGIVVGLRPPTDGFAADCITTVPDAQNTTETLTVSELAAIKADPTQFYVNVHNASFQAGAIRGQLR
jgi:CHRD domain